jgi:hypothetical protein
MSDSGLLHLARAAEELALRRQRLAHSAPGGLFTFIRDLWPVVEPTTPFVDGWCLRGICEHLEAVHHGRIKRLLINVPPGFAKSLTVNTFFPAWEWGAMGRSDHRYLSFSYAAHLTERDNGRLLAILRSQHYQRLYGKTVKPIAEGRVKLEITGTGWKFASSVGGVGTGERGSRILLDDPHNIAEGESETILRSTMRWFRESMQNRLNSLEDDAIVVIMQRVSEGDISGIIIENYPQYVHLCVPMEYEVGRKCTTSIGWSDPRSDTGQLAWPERYSDETLLPFKTLPYMWGAQYQQSPEPRGGGIIKREWWRIWGKADEIENDVKPGAFPVFEFVLASFDGAYTERKENDPSALSVWGLWFKTDDTQRAIGLPGMPQIMLIDAWRKWLPLHGADPEQYALEDDVAYLKRKRDKQGIVECIADTCRKWKVDKLLIEGKATGFSVEQEMRRLFSREKFSCQIVDPGHVDKAGRAHVVSHLFADGIIWRPDREWAILVEDELASLPHGRYDDLADTATMALNWFRKNGLAVRRDESSARAELILRPEAPTRSRMRYET